MAVEPLVKRAKPMPPRLGEVGQPRDRTGFLPVAVLQSPGGPHAVAVLQSPGGPHVAWATEVLDNSRNGHGPQPNVDRGDMGPSPAVSGRLVATERTEEESNTPEVEEEEDGEGDLTEEEERARQSHLRNLMKRPSFGHILNTLRESDELAQKVTAYPLPPQNSYLLPRRPWVTSSNPCFAPRCTP